MVFKLISIFALAGIPIWAQTPETLISQDGLTTYNCPTRQTIDTAYYGYCPSTDQGGSPLVGHGSLALYANAAQNDFTIITPSSDFQLYCIYDSSPEACAYSAGGGPLSYSSGPASCPSVDPVVLQPSPGVNYRRSSAVSRRANIGPEPMFTCPFSSTDGNFHSDITQNGVGNNNLFNGVNVPNPSQDLIYSCSINDGLVDCRYYQDASGNLVYIVGTDGQDASKCPMTLCTAVKTGTPVSRRGIFTDERQMSLQRRQVDTAALRKKAAMKGRR